MDNLTSLGMLAGGFVLLIGGAEIMVRYASRLGLHYGLRPVVIGTTIVAFGTSAPEFVVSYFAALEGNPGLSLGNAVGSNVANIGLVLGLTAILSPIPVTKGIIKVEYFAALIASGLMVWLAWDGHLDRNDGVVLIGVFALFFAAYVLRAVAVRGAGRGEKTVGAFAGRKKTKPRDCWLLTLLGIALLLVGARLVILGASDIARALGVSEAAIGATIVALGTSLPEVAASLVAAMKKEHELALGNVLGSNLFNMLFVLGPAAIHPGLVVTGDLIRSHMIIMMLITVLLLPLMLIRLRVDRKSGLLLLGIYLAFLLLNVGVSLGWFPLPGFLKFGC